MEDKCVCCGSVVPEGRQVCRQCEEKFGLVRCGECVHGSHVDCPEGRVWCDKVFRYMVYEGYCSYGKKRCEDG